MAVRDIFMYLQARREPFCVAGAILLRCFQKMRCISLLTLKLEILHFALSTLHPAHFTLYTPHFALLTPYLFHILQCLQRTGTVKGETCTTLVQICCFIKVLYVTAFGFMGCIFFPKMPDRIDPMPGSKVYGRSS